MARVGIIFGLILCGLSVVGLVSTMTKNPVQFFPMMLGIPILFCGVVALNPHRRKHAMHVSLGIALFGTVLGGGRALYVAIRWAGGETINAFSLKMVTAMTVFCLVFAVICLVSFLQARRRPGGETPSAKATSKANPRTGIGKDPELKATGAGPDGTGSDDPWPANRN